MCTAGQGQVMVSSSPGGDPLAKFGEEFVIHARIFLDVSLRL
ncbi:hypothetical protein [Nonomuraea basaltis]|nr:hypothetical protein [Nonomuraea basaltis]